MNIVKIAGLTTFVFIPFFLIAKPDRHKIEIVEGGRSFVAFYRISYKKDPKKKSKNSLFVKVKAERPTIHMPPPPLFEEDWAREPMPPMLHTDRSCTPGPFTTKLSCHIKNRLTTLQTLEKPVNLHQFQENKKAQNSFWYSALKELQRKVVKGYYPLQTLTYQDPLLNLKREQFSPALLDQPASQDFHIQPLSRCSAFTRYAMQLASGDTFSRYSFYRTMSQAQGIVVKIHTTEKKLAKYNKKMIVSSASFQVATEKVYMGNLIMLNASIQFVHTKKGLKELSRKNIKRSLFWYPRIKKVVQKSVKTYLQFKKVHESL